jgi:lipase ATG15
MNGYTDLVHDFVRDMDKTGVTEIIITGHSLGGGLSKIISARTGYQAVAFSGPGINSIGPFYAWKDIRIKNSFVNVVPNLDPVALVDVSSGSDFVIPCESGVWECHSMARTQCMLATLCGEIQKHIEWCDSVMGTAEMDEIFDLGRPYQYEVPMDV